jgi:O-antigen/teichoic acid export membrane protein
MMTLLIKLLRFAGVDRAVGYGVLARLWQIIAGPVSMIVIATNLSREQQGFYFTFNSLVALQLFFELGLTGVIATFVSHEFVDLTWGNRGTISGDPRSLQRLEDILAKATLWFSVASVLLFIVLIPAGLLFFGQGKHAGVDFSWRLPWILVVAGTSCNLMVTPFFSVVMGSGDVANVNKREMLGAVLGPLLSWTVLLLHGGLFAAPAVAFGNMLVSWLYLARQKPELLKKAWDCVKKLRLEKHQEARVSWRGEIWPLQWKIALSWISGYFLFQLFNPVLFHYQGPVVAGQMGMTLSATNALMGVCITWMSAKSPEFGKLIAQREWRQLDKLFNRVLLQTFVISVIGATIGWSAIWFLQGHYKIGARFIPASDAAFLLAAVCLVVVVFGLATYLRAHKQEPFMVLSISSALIQGSLIWVMGKYFSSRGVSMAYFAVSLFFVLPYAVIIWRRCRRMWHSEGEGAVVK